MSSKVYELLLICELFFKLCYLEMKKTTHWQYNWTPSLIIISASQEYSFNTPMMTPPLRLSFTHAWAFGLWWIYLDILFDKFKMVNSCKCLMNTNYQPKELYKHSIDISRDWTTFRKYNIINCKQGVTYFHLSLSQGTVWSPH